jgi:hypothetical protein
MSDLRQVVHHLQSQVRTKEHEIEKLNLAIKALSAVGGSTGLSIRTKPKFSAAARERIAAAQRLRWKKLKASQKK